MTRHILSESASIFARNRHRSRWQRVVTSMAAVVVFITVYALVLPAVTMERQSCELEEHVHSLSCYQQLTSRSVTTDVCPVQAHVHSQACLDARGTYVCGYRDVILHTHEDTCYTPEGTLWCSLPEVEAHVHEAGCMDSVTHSHTPGCSVEERGELLCKQEEVPGHKHGEGCWKKPLICDQEEHPLHKHGEGCFAPEVICGMEETSGHSHTSACEQTTQVLSCGMEETLGHSHGEGCLDEGGNLVCGMEEAPSHSHGTGCYTSSTVYICGMVEAPAHTHGDGCYGESRQICGQEETPGHAHTDACYGSDAELVCSLKETPGHSHTDECYQMEAKYVCGLEEGEQELVPVCGKTEYVPHTHVDSCFDRNGNWVCGQWELIAHQHADACRQTTEETLNPEELTCTLEETSGHTHGEGCFDGDGEQICTLEETSGHTHGDLCYGTWELICQKQEHTHTDSCQKPENTELREFQYEDDALALTLQVASPEPLPEDVRLEVVPVSQELYDLLTAGEDNQDGSWILRDVYLALGESVLDTTDFDMLATIQVKAQPLSQEAALNVAQAAMEGESISMAMEVAAWQVGEDGEQTPVDSALFPVEEETPSLSGRMRSGTLMIRAGAAANPEYTVQYYGNIIRSTTLNPDATLSVIYNLDGSTPKNGDKSTQNTAQMPLRKVEDKAGYYRVNSVPTLTELYATKNYFYTQAPSITYVEQLADSDGYTLEEIWVLKEGKNADSLEKDDWDVYDAQEIHFTNRPEFAQDKENVLCVQEGTVLRLVYDIQDSSFTTTAAFYDYDISSGQNGDGKWRTGTAGINSKTNYGTSANGETTWTSYKNVLAFGNTNTGTGMGKYAFDGIYLNGYSEDNEGGCCFGLVKGVDAEGKLIYNDWVVAPNLFNDGEATGKHSYTGNLTFNRQGDTYTLSSTTVAGKTTSDLNYFQNPNNGLKTHTDIFTNDFWPMDGVTNMDPHIGKYAGNGSAVTNEYFQGYTSEDNPTGSWTAQSARFPISDDGKAHNCFFGMQYNIEFTLDENYVGPLDYIFFGDDDMWVFLDGKLVCDIGGVHSSVGNYVDLWQHLEKGDSGKHTLSFFYTERGASGSTCYMSFTLPSITGVTVEQNSTDLTIQKTAVGEADEDKEFKLNVQFFQGQTAVLDDYVYTHFNKDGSVKKNDLVACSGTDILLKSGEWIRVEHLPYGLNYRIEELDTQGYTVSHTINGVAGQGDATVAVGSIVRGTDNQVSFLNTVNRVGLDVYKVGPDGRTALSGANFWLTEEDGTYCYFQKGNDGVYTLTDEEHGDVELPVGEDGYLHLAGLFPGNYVLFEVRAPEHYQRLEDGIPLNLDSDGSVTLSPDVSDDVTTDDNDKVVVVKNHFENKNLVLTKLVKNLENIPDEKFTFRVSYVQPAIGEGLYPHRIKLGHEDVSVPIEIPYGAVVTIEEFHFDGYQVVYLSQLDEDEAEILESKDGKCTFTMTEDMVIVAENRAGYALPSTGGTGTLGFTLGGITMVLLAAIWLCRRRKEDVCF